METAIRTLGLPGSHVRQVVTVGSTELETLFELHHQALWRFAVRMVSDPDRAHDLVQDTFVRALGRKLPAAEGAARAWLMQTLVNLCRDLHRRRKVRWAHSGRIRQDDADRGGAVDPEGSAVARATLDRAIRRLSPRRRAVLVLRELEGRSGKQVAATLGLTEATVRWHLAKARRDLRELLVKESKR